MHEKTPKLLSVSETNVCPYYLRSVNNSLYLRDVYRRVTTLCTLYMKAINIFEHKHLKMMCEMTQFYGFLLFSS